MPATLVRLRRGEFLLKTRAGLIAARARALSSYGSDRTTSPPTQEETMRVRSVVTACALTLAVATGAMAQSSVPGPGMQDGVVAEVDSAAGVVKLQDGRMYRVASGTEIVVKGEPVPLGALRPGNYVTINGAQPVIYRDGQYVQVPSN